MLQQITTRIPLLVLVTLLTCYWSHCATVGGAWIIKQHMGKKEKENDENLIVDDHVRKLRIAERNYYRLKVSLFWSTVCL